MKIYRIGRRIHFPGKGHGAKAMVCLFFLLLFTPNGAGAVLSGENANLEKRTLAGFPQVTGDNWEEAPKLAEAYINDHAPLRYQVLDAYAAFNWKVFGAVDNRDVIRGKDGWLFYRGNGSMTDVLGLNIFSEEAMEMILGKLLEVRETYVDGPEQFVLFIAPNKEQVYRQYMPDCYQEASGTSTARAFAAYIREHSDIKVVYPLEELKEASGAGDVYHKTDTHWNRLGGLVGTQCLLEALGGAGTEPDLEEAVWETKGYRGDLADQIHLPDQYVDDYEVDIQKNPDGTEPETKGEEHLFQSRRVFAPDGRTCVMVRDSFGEHMLPWLAQYFEETTVVHYSEIPRMSGEGLEGEVLVYEIVERYLGELPGRLEDMLKAGGISGSAGAQP